MDNIKGCGLRSDYCVDFTCEVRFNLVFHDSVFMVSLVFVKVNRW